MISHHYNLAKNRVTYTILLLKTFALAVLHAIVLYGASKYNIDTVQTVYCTLYGRITLRVLSPRVHRTYAYRIVCSPFVNLIVAYDERSVDVIVRWRISTFDMHLTSVIGELLG